MAKSISAVFGTVQEIKSQLCWLQVCIFLLLFLSVMDSPFMSPASAMPILPPTTGYVHTDPMEVGLAYVNCSGTEGALEECAVAMTTTITPCSQAGIVRQCLNGD